MSYSWHWLTKLQAARSRSLLAGLAAARRKIAASTLKIDPRCISLLGRRLPAPPQP